MEEIQNRSPREGAQPFVTHNHNKINVSPHIYSNMSVTGKQQQLMDKEAVHELVSRLRGTGGVPLSDAYTRSLKCWLVTLAKRGWLDCIFILQRKEEIEKSFKEAFPNSGSRSNFSRAVLQFFAALTDDEFSNLYPDVSRKDVVDVFRGVAAEANRGVGSRLRAAKPGEANE
jgi:hypothetical protein